MPRTQCGLWTPALLLTYLLSACTIALSYFAITLTIAHNYRTYGRTGRMRADARWLSIGFAAFIFACGSSHAVDATIFFVPLYRFQTMVLSVTALLSVSAAALTPSIMRRLGVGFQTIEQQAETIADAEKHMRERDATIRDLRRELVETQSLMKSWLVCQGIDIDEMLRDAQAAETELEGGSGLDGGGANG